MSIRRLPENPLITPADVQPSCPDFEVIAAFNAGVVAYKDEILLLLRVAERPRAQEQNQLLVPVYDPKAAAQIRLVEFKPDDPRLDISDPRCIRFGEEIFLTSISHLRVARSKDGIHFRVDRTPALFPVNTDEAYGIEDPRIIFIEGNYYVNYTAVSQRGIATGLAKTQDFQEFVRLGLIFPPENRDVTIFPEKIKGKYYALHRPVPRHFGAPEIWLASSPDLLHWGGHQHLLSVDPEGWSSSRIGGGAVPIKTKAGWLIIYHGADAQNQYAIGALLLDLDDPSKLLGRTRKPFLFPEQEYERRGFFGNVVFTCGALVLGTTVRIYYGVCDTAMAAAEIELEALLAMIDRS